MSVYRFDDFVVDTEARELLRSGQTVRVSPKAFRLLEVLVSTRPKAWSKSELQDALWPETTVVEGNLANLVGELRAALGDDPSRPRYIRTIQRHGYGFLDTAAASARPVAASPSRAFAFVGRADELTLMQDAWQRAGGGNRQVMFIAGEPGIGKTSLVAEFGRRCAETGAIPLLGRCDREAIIPYQPFVEALGQLIERFSDAELRQQVRDGGVRAELTRLVPTLVDRISDFAPQPLTDPESERFRLFQAVDQLLSRTSARTPIILSLDDLHWADRSSLLLLRHLARGSTSNSVLLLGTYRGEDVERTPLGELLTDLRRERLGARLTLQGLQTNDVEHLIETVTGNRTSRAFAESVTDETSGNPFFIREILQHLREKGDLHRLSPLRANRSGGALALPESIKEVIGQRLGQLSHPCNRALSLASVLGREFRFDLLARIGRFDEDELLDALDAARAAGVVVEVVGDVGRLSFSHALVREALYDKLSATRRVRLHLQAAEALERFSDPANLPLGDLAYHFTQAAPVGDAAAQAIKYATRAAERAVTALAQNEAARFYDMALTALPFKPGTGSEGLATDLHALRGDALATIGNWPEAKQSFAAALQNLGPGNLQRRAQILLKLAMAHFWLLEIADLRPLVTEALQIAEGLNRPDLIGEALGWLGRAEQADGNLDAAIKVDRKAFRFTGGAATGALVHAPLTLYLAGRLPDALVMAERALADAQRKGESSAILYALSHYGLALAGSGRYVEAATTFEEARKLGRSCGAYPLLARATAMAAGWHLDVFDYAGAEALQSEARQIASEEHFVPTLASAGIELLMTYARQEEPGRAEGIQREVEDAVRNARGWHAWLFRLRLEHAYAELALARAEWTAAADYATSAIDCSRAAGRGKYEAAALAIRSRARHALGRTQEASEDARAACVIARKVSDPALEVKTFAQLLPVIGDDALLLELRKSVSRVMKALPSNLRTRFAEAPILRTAIEPCTD